MIRQRQTLRAGLWSGGAAIALVAVAVMTPAARAGYWTRINTYTTRAKAWDVTDSHPNIETGNVAVTSQSIGPINLHAAGPNSDGYFNFSAAVELGTSPCAVFAEHIADSHASTGDSGCSGGGDVRASFSDRITITHESLPYGTYVDFAATLDLDGTFTLDSVGNATKFGLFSASFWVDSLWLYFDRNQDDPLPGGPWEESGTVSLRVGYTYSISGGLRTQIGGDGYVGGYSHTTADFANTMNVGITPLTAGAGYVSDSGANYTPGPAVLLGDANNDGVVSADDFAAVQTNFGNTGAADGLLPGDANDDGVVSADDFAAIQTNFGNVLGAGAEGDPIPEPVTMCLLAISAVAVVQRRRRA